MYNISIPVDINAEPWNIPIEKRCKMLREYILTGLPVVAMIYDHPDTSTFRYRGYNVSQSMIESKCFKSIYFFSYEINYLLPILNEISILVFIRTKWTHKLSMLIQMAKNDHIPVLFDVDDLVFDIHSLPQVTNTLNVTFKDEFDYDFWFAYISRIENVAMQADGFITTNAFLGEKLKSKFNKPYGIIPNFLNKEQLIISQKLVNIKQVKKSKRPFTIGYFSGTPSHINDFKTVYKELLTLIDEFNDVQLKVVGFMEFPEELAPLIKKGRITFIPLVDFLELQRQIAEVDINIVPLVNNSFTNCKSELKYFEAAIVQTPTIAEPTFTYSKCISDGVNGFLCKPGQWYQVIKNIYLGNININPIIVNAYNHTLQNYQGKAIIKMIEECYSMFMR